MFDTIAFACIHSLTRPLSLFYSTASNWSSFTSSALHRLRYCPWSILSTLLSTSEGDLNTPVLLIEVSWTSSAIRTIRLESTLADKK